MGVGCGWEKHGLAPRSMSTSIDIFCQRGRGVKGFVFFTLREQWLGTERAACPWLHPHLAWDPHLRWGPQLTWEARCDSPGSVTSSRTFFLSDAVLSLFPLSSSLPQPDWELQKQWTSGSSHRHTHDVGYGEHTSPTKLCTICPVIIAKNKRSTNTTHPDTCTHC